MVTFLWFTELELTFVVPVKIISKVIYLYTDCRRLRFRYKWDLIMI